MKHPSIFLLTRTNKVSGGQGGEYSIDICLARLDYRANAGYLPAFSSREKLNTFVKENPQFKYYAVLEVPVL